VDHVCYPNVPDAFKGSDIRFVLADTARLPREVLMSLQGPNVLLYCDAGSKEEDLTRFSPLLEVGSLLATHDYGTEVGEDFANLLASVHGYTRVMWEEFSAMTRPHISRFWLREDFSQCSAIYVDSS
jgi:hypothetical protein